MLVALCIAVFFALEQYYPSITDRNLDESSELLDDDVVSDANPESPTSSSPDIGAANPPKPTILSVKSTPPLYPLEASAGEQVANGIKCPCAEADCVDTQGPLPPLSLEGSRATEDAGCCGDLHYCKQLHGVLHGVAAGVVGAQSLVFGKASAEMITGEVRGDTGEELDVPVLLFCITFMLLTVVLQLITLNRGLRYHTTLLVVPVYQTLWTLTGILGAAICFNEFADHTFGETILFAGGGIAMLAGLWCLVRAQEAPKLPSQATESNQQGEASPGSSAPPGMSPAADRKISEVEVQMENSVKGG